MLVDNLFKISNIQLTEGAILAQVKINVDNTVFDGHFPSNPVTPGVLQVQLVKEILEEHFGKSLELLSMSRCKFLAILNPVLVPEISVNIKILENDDIIKVNALGKSDSNSFFKFSASYKQ